MLIESAEEFRRTLPREARLLGLDVGEKTIGLALTDLTRTVASPLLTIERKKFTKDMEQLMHIIHDNKVAALVIGNPINMDGSAGPRVQSIRTFVANVGKYTDLPMLLWDERLSTVAVERVMLDADLSRKRRAELVDKLAASYMLQGFLDSVASS